MTALEQFNECSPRDELSPLERLRLFGLFAMNDRDWVDAEPFFNAARDEVARTKQSEKEGWRYAAELEQERGRYREALQMLEGCDWVITLPDRMDAVRKIAREALSEGVRVE